MRTEEIISKESQYILQTYVRPEFVIERGNGVYLFDTDGNRYLDFVSGLAVNAFGYGDYDILKAIEEQSAQLMHVSNLYHTIPSVQLAQMLVEQSFADRAFFCNSGTEAWEASLKFCRKWGSSFDKPKNRFIAMNDSFHGRTYGSISTTGQPKYHQGFEPMLPGIDFADFNDLASVEKLVTDETCAILVEPLQAEGGINVASQEFLQGLRKLCDEREILLVFDEIQVGLGRTGSLWAHEQYEVEPDVMTLAKALGG
ncbi:MAG: aminotransferase class III-fold pyridoxal phosphate-dependent enzyme, partial [Gemmatimonadetes bacterium]|nr:aminotransferase class III-fold pyridoxal phosphate-dependent enzyme [Gemmatimonadota bacterium]